MTDTTDCMNNYNCGVEFQNTTCRGMVKQSGSAAALIATLSESSNEMMIMMVASSRLVE